MRTAWWERLSRVAIATALSRAAANDRSSSSSSADHAGPGALISSPSALAWHEEIIDNREDEQCQQKPVEYRFPFALEKLVCVHFPFALSPSSTNWRMSRDPNIAGFHLAVASTGSVESQSIANSDSVRIYSRRLQFVDVQEHIRPAGVVCDKSEAAVGIPHFQFSGGHPIFPSS